MLAPHNQEATGSIPGWGGDFYLIFKKSQPAGDAYPSDSAQLCQFKLYASETNWACTEDMYFIGNDSSILGTKCWRKQK